MSKKKRFGISEALTRGLTETINVVENNTGTFRHVVLPLSRIELDPDNPRKLAITLQDVRTGIRSEDVQSQRKQDELERLKELAHTIESQGVINPIVVYKRGEHYRVVAGERRCLASIIAGKQEIDARVFNDKPKAFDLKLIQWVENTAREDLTLAERLGNVRDIVEQYSQQYHVEVNASVLKNITGLSLSQTSYYLAALNAPEEITNFIENGTIRNLDKAALLANIKSSELRNAALQACINGASIKALRTIANQKPPKSVAFPIQERGRKASKINMGSTMHTHVVKHIVDGALAHPSLLKHRDTFARVDWFDLKQTTKAFKRLVAILETEILV